MFSLYSLLQNLLKVEINREILEFCLVVGTGVLDGPRGAKFSVIKISK